MHNGLVALPMLVVKKYPNRRLYDTTASRYITLEDLAELIKKGSDVLVQDATTGLDLTQQVLTQIILESRGGARLLPVPLLLRLIRLGDEALAEFFGRYISWALELYVNARGGARALAPLNPLASVPFAATDALARLVLGATQWVSPSPPMPTPTTAPSDPPPPPESAIDMEPFALPPPAPSSTSLVSSDVADDVARLRAELEALKQSLTPAKKRPAKKTAKKH